MRLLALLLLAAAGCPGPAEVQQDGSSEAAAGDSSLCVPALYPCGPYGTAKGEVAADRHFQGYADPGHLCKSPAAMKPDLGKLRSLSFADWYGGSSACPSKEWRLLWVMVGAGWCSSCKTEVAAIQSKLGKHELDDRVALLNVLYETTSVGDPVDEAFLLSWAKGYGLTFPVAMDPKFTMGKYFSSSEAPFNLLLELKTMQILYAKTGSNLPGVMAAVQDALK